MAAFGAMRGAGQAQGQPFCQRCLKARLPASGLGIGCPSRWVPVCLSVSSLLKTTTFRAQYGKWTYECCTDPSSRVYVSRPSRTQQLKHPKMRQAFADPKDQPPDPGRDWQERIEARCPQRSAACISGAGTGLHPHPVSPVFRRRFWARRQRRHHSRVQLRRQAQQRRERSAAGNDDAAPGGQAPQRG